MRRPVALLLLALLGLAQAQVCRAELERAAALAGPRPGLRAAALLHEAHRLVEPAYPARRRLGPAGLPLDGDAPGYDAVRYLAERQLLPDGWRRDELDTATWQAMIDAFTAGYGLGPVPVGEPTGFEPMVDDALRALTAVSGAVRPAALIATDQEDGETLVFLAVLWNWTPYPRLLVFNPRGHSLSAGIEPLLAGIGGCALRLEDYILAREETAARLFLGNNESTVIVVGSDPDLRRWWPLSIAAGDEVAFLSFARPEVAELAALSVEFEGPSLGFFDAIGLFARVQTNMSPARLLYHLDFPPR